MRNPSSPEHDGGENLSVHTVPKPGMIATATIRKVEEKSAADLFGLKAKKPETRMLVISAEIEGTLHKIATLSRSFNIRSKLVKLCSKLGIDSLSDDYRELLGQQVEVQLVATGYYNLVI